MKDILSKDIVWRPIGIIMALLLSFGALQAINKSNQTSLIQPLEIMARNGSWQAQSWLDDHYEQAYGLASDKRLVQAFESDNWEAAVLLVRRALYEFSYLNDFKNVYAFNPNKEPALVRTANAPAIPYGVFTIMRQNHTADTVADSLLVNAAGKPSLLVLHTVKNREDVTVGYIAYLLDIPTAISSFNVSGVTQVLDAKLGLIRDRGDNRIVMIEDALNAISRLSVFSASQTNIPVLNEPDPTGIYNHNGTNIIASAQAIAEHPGWYTLTYVEEGLVAAQSALWKNIIRGVAGFIIFCLILVPGRGPYGRLLKKAGRTAQPKNIKNIAQGRGIDHDPVATITSAMEQAFDERGAQILGNNQSFAAPKGSTMRAGKLPELPEAEATKIEKERTKDEPPEERQAFKDLETDDQTIGEKNKELFFSKARKKSDDDEKELSDNIIVYIIRCCIRDENIKLLYQPVYDSKTRQIVMYEVFLRLLDDDGEMLPPAKFMPVAEANNLMPELDECVISFVLKKHFREGCVPPPVPLSINLSGNTFESISYLQKLMNSSLDFHIEPGALVYELKSDEIVADSRAMDFIRECRDIGFRFSIDYFGGGTQTVQAARSLKFDFMKVDAFSFQELATNKDQQKELFRLSQAANQSGLTLVVERIESNLMAKFATKVGVNGLQGYLFAQPEEQFLNAEDHSSFSLNETSDNSASEKPAEAEEKTETEQPPKAIEEPEKAAESA